jgi:hypothetical protein
LDHTSSYSTLRHSRSTNTLFRPASVPSVLIAMAFLIGRRGERSCCELRALVCVEDVRLAVSGQRLLQRLDAARRHHGSLLAQLAQHA